MQNKFLLVTPVALRGRQGLRQFCATLWWVLKPLHLLQASWYSHIPNVRFAVLVAWCKAMNLCQYCSCISSAITTLVQQTSSRASSGYSMFRFLRPPKQSNQKTSQTVAWNLPEVVGQFPFHLVKLMFLCTTRLPLYWCLLLSTCSFV